MALTKRRRSLGYMYGDKKSDGIGKRWGIIRHFIVSILASLKCCAGSLLSYNNIE